jgi:hypothetical protein
MPATPMTTAVPPLGNPKLRSSCDSCGTAKVRCDRSQPECGRCANLGLACVYGLSRQSGKPPRKRPLTDLEATSRSRKRPAYSDESRNHQTAFSYAQPQLMNESGHTILSTSVIETTPTASSLTNTARMEEQTLFSSAFLTPLLFDDCFQLDSFGFDLDIPSVPKDSALEERGPASALEPISSVRVDSISRRSHSCPRESYEILRDLICPNPYLHAPEADSDPVSAQLDEVLRCTRNAIDRLTRLLRCPCARSMHRVMVHSSIISRILLWYQQAAGWTCSNAWPPLPLVLVNSPASSAVSSSSPPPHETSTQTDATNIPTLAQSTGFVVENVPVSLGTFSIEDQNVQAAFRDQLVLSELKKTARLIDLFISQDSSESPANGISDIHVHLGAWLRSEHSRTVRVLTTRLNALNESLKHH